MSRSMASPCIIWPSELVSPAMSAEPARSASMAAMVVPAVSSLVCSSMPCWRMSNAATAMALTATSPIANRLSLGSSPKRTVGALSGVVVSTSGELDLAMERASPEARRVPERPGNRRRLRRHLGHGHRNLADALLPLAGTGLVDRMSFGVDGDRHWHVFDLEFVNRFHSEVSEPNDARAHDGLGYEICCPSDGHQVRGVMATDRLDRDRTALCFADHGDQTGLAQHHLRELVHSRRSGRTRRTDDFVTHRIDRTDVIDHPVAEVDRQRFPFGEHVDNALVRGIASREQFSIEQQPLAGTPRS